LPADGVEKLIRLRFRVRKRLQENAEVLGTDETFFEDEQHDNILRDMFTEKSGSLDDPEDDEVDLSSLAYQIWRNATDADPSLRKAIPDMPNVVFSTKPLIHPQQKEDTAESKQQAYRGGDTRILGPSTGVMVYVRTGDDNDALTWVDEDGSSSQIAQRINFICSGVPVMWWVAQCALT